MKTINKFAGIVMLAALTLSASAKADSLIGVKASFGHFTASGNNQVAGGSNTVGSHEVNFPYGSIFAEHKIFSSGWSLGLDYIPFKAEVDARSKSDTDLQGGTTTATGTKKATANIENHATLYVNTPSINGFYGKAGYSYADVKITDFAVLSGQAAISKSKDTLSGPMIGIGYEKELANGLILKTDITYTVYDKISFNGASGSQVSADTENLAAHIGIAKRF